MKQFLCLILSILVLISSSACSIQTDQEPLSTPAVSAPVDEVSNIPVTWESLNLKGRLIYSVAYFKGGSGKGGLSFAIRSLDLTTGDVTLIYETQVGAWIRSLAVSPDQKNLIIGYAPVPNSPSDSTREELYKMPLDGSQPPQLLFTPPSDQDQYDQPAWSPDGKYLYFTHFNNQSSSPSYEIMRLAYPNGKLESLVDHAYWPRISADGSAHCLCIHFFRKRTQRTLHRKRRWNRFTYRAFIWNRVDT